MGSFSKLSKDRLDTCHPDLQLLFEEVVKHYDCSIIEGHRGEEAQSEAFKNGKSKTPWPKSKHNSFPSLAVDVAPLPLDWNYDRNFYLFAGFVIAVAATMGIKIRWGGCWNMDWNTKNNAFKDLPHFELVE